MRSPCMSYRTDCSHVYADANRSPLASNGLVYCAYDQATRQTTLDYVAFCLDASLHVRVANDNIIIVMSLVYVNVYVC